ncbi:MAG: NblA/ycf18 family protein [Cyanobacteria bacterium P01_G01_bin.67]
MNDSQKLSLEQEFNLRTFADQVGNLTSEEAQGLSIELYRRIMLKDNLYEELLKDYWGISSVPMSA